MPALSNGEMKNGFTISDIIPAKASEIYEAWLSSEGHSAMTGSAAQVDGKVGGKFTAWDGYISRTTLDLTPNQRIVQAWRVVTWPEGDYSIARFDLKPQGSGTHVIFDHIGFPEGLHDHLAQGWEENYWSLLKKYFH